MKFKVCTKCDKKKKLTDFYAVCKGRGGEKKESQCKKCKRKYKKIWRQKNPEYHRNYALIKNYGITLEDYKKILEVQNFKCDLCKRPRSKFKRNFDVDHNHKTGFIRGLICNYCNYRLMRFFKDDKQLMINLINYLKNALKNDKKWSKKI